MVAVIEIAYAVCAFIILLPVPGVLQYQLYTNNEYDVTLEHPNNIVEVCQDDYPQVFICEPGYGCYIKSDYYYNAIGTGANPIGISTKLEIRWVGDADFDDDGVVGFLDFGLFIQAFGSNDPVYDLNGDGNVGFPDFGEFTVRFGDCLSENLVKVVPCDAS